MMVDFIWAIVFSIIGMYLFKKLWDYMKYHSHQEIEKRKHEKIYRLLKKQQGFDNRIDKLLKETTKTK